MSIQLPEPHPNEFNKALHTRRDNDNVSNLHIGLEDIDKVLLDHMNNVISPRVSDPDGTSYKVPIQYASAENWHSVRINGYVRDQKGQIQIPLVIFKRNNVSKSDDLSAFGALNRFQRRTYVKRYSRKNKYDKFSVMNGVQPTIETYNVVSPDHVTLTYECVAWTYYVDHMNEIIEQFNFADDSYWGDRDKFLFRSSIGSFDISHEVPTGEDRMVKASFTLTVHAYLLPEQFANEITTEKSFTPKRVVVTIKEMTSSPGIADGFTTENSTLNSYQVLFDYLTMNNQYTGTFISAASGSYALFKFENTELMPVPPELTGEMTNDDRFDVYINGVVYDPVYYTLTNSTPLQGNYDVTINFDVAGLGFELDGSDAITIKGKIMGVDNGSFATLILGRNTRGIDPLEDYQAEIDFLAINNEFDAVFSSSISGSDAVFYVPNVEMLNTPASLVGTIDDSSKWQVYLNGVEQTSDYTLTNSNRFQGNDNVLITFDQQALLMYLTGSDAVVLKGKVVSI